MVFQPTGHTKQKIVTSEIIGAKKWIESFTDLNKASADHMNLLRPLKLIWFMTRYMFLLQLAEL